jgi:hypothetical protein
MNRIFLLLVCLMGGVNSLQVYNNIFYKNPLGGLDEHGCFPGAGYTYCNYTNRCHRFDKECLP